MIFNAVTLLLALAPSTLFAAPTPSKTVDSIADLIAKRSLNPEVVKQLTNDKCDLSNAVMPVAPTPLPPPSEGLKLSHVAVGRGTQNYTCDPTAQTDPSASPVPKALGALATLFNVTCDVVRSPDILADATNYALKYDIPTGDIADLLESGHHEFNTQGKPFFKLVTPQADFGFVQAKAAANSTAPDGASKGTNGEGSVLWLKLTGTDGVYKEVYRINTAGGVAPKKCEGIYGEFQVPYAAEYWFYK